MTPVVNTEYGSLAAILLARPHPKIAEAASPREVLHIRKIDYAVIADEFVHLVRLYKKLKVKVVLVNARPRVNQDNLFLYNVIFMRDLFFMTNRGAIMAKMFSPVRRDEVKFAERKLRLLNVPIRWQITEGGTFEGADALWVNRRLVMVGVGQRTNSEGFRQVQAELRKDNIRCVDVPAPRHVLHLLGAVQLIDSDLALLRSDLVDSPIVDVLQRQKMKIIEVPENAEVKFRQAFNFVTVAPRSIIMPADCPRMRKIYERSGIRVLAEIPTSQFVNAGGGLACATGIVARS